MMRQGVPVLLPCLLAWGLLGGCSRPPEKPAAPFNTEIPLNEVMLHVLEPAAYGFWDGAGTVHDASGLHDLTPKTEEEWLRVENGAATVAIGANSLMLEGYAQAPDAAWYAYARKLGEVALEGKAAAERKDAKALFEIGGRLDEACEACHAEFLPENRQKPGR